MKQLLFLQIILSLSVIANSQTPRGRVKIKNGTLVTDKGTLLRGGTDLSPFTNVVWKDVKADIAQMKSMGLNCLHIYPECPEFQHVGERKSFVDSVVKWTRIDSLYLILTIGGGYTRNGQFDSAFVMDFWNIYAPRYKNEAHVIYEICNEPFSWSSPYDRNTLAMERWAYDTIRSLAPETHILFMSYANAINADSVANDIKKIGKGIDWKNASIASHGYGAASENVRGFIKTVKALGYAITITEPYSTENKYANLATTRVFEEEFVSYAHFVGIESMNDDPSVYKSLIESSEIRWKPDFGAWPNNLNKINYRNPFLKIIAGFYDEGKGFNIDFPKTDIGYISREDYVAYYNLDFEDGPIVFKAECSSGANGGIIELHLDSLHGTMVGSFIVEPTGSWDVYKTFSCQVSHSVGFHKLYLVFKGANSYDLFNLRSFQFSKTLETESTTPMQNHMVQLYPNPANGLFTLTFESTPVHNANITVTNIQGTSIISKSFQNTKSVTLDLTSHSAGIYMVKIIADGECYEDKIVKE